MSFREARLAEKQGRQKHTRSAEPAGQLPPIFRSSAIHFAFPSRAEFTAQIHDATPYAATGELMTSWTLYRSSAMRTRRTFISVRLSSPKMIRTTATTTFSNASSCSLFILLFRVLLPDNLVTFSVPVSLRLGAELSGERAFEMVVARGLADGARFNAGMGGAALNDNGGAGLFG